MFFGEQCWASPMSNACLETWNEHYWLFNWWPACYWILRYAGMWSLPWPDTLCLLMYSSLGWLMREWSVPLPAEEALNPSLYTDCFCWSDLWSHNGEENEGSCSRGCTERHKSQPKILRRVRVTCDKQGMCNAVIVVWPRQELISTFLQLVFVDVASS